MNSTVKHGLYISKEGIVRTYRCGKLHSSKFPSMYYYKSEDYYFAYWHYDGVPHREGGPSQYSRDHDYYREYWRVHGKYHREDGPAILFKNMETSTVTLIDWFLNDERVLNCSSVRDLRRYKLKAFL